MIIIMSFIWIDQKIMNPHPERSNQEIFFVKLTCSKLQQGLAKFNSFFWKKKKTTFFTIHKEKNYSVCGKRQKTSYLSFFLAHYRSSTDHWDRINSDWLTEDLLLLPIEVRGLGQGGKVPYQEEGLVNRQQGLVQRLHIQETIDSSNYNKLQDINQLLGRLVFELTDDIRYRYLELGPALPTGKSDSQLGRGYRKRRPVGVEGGMFSKHFSF